MAPKKGKKPGKASGKSASAEKFLDFLVRLSEDKELQADFKENARETMTKAGLTAAQQKALRSGDLQRIDALLPEFGKGRMPMMPMMLMMPTMPTMITMFAPCHHGSGGDWLSSMVRPKRYRKQKGSLTLVGTGIKAVSHLTTEARFAIENAEKLYYLAADPVTTHWLEGHNKTAESLFRFYSSRKNRMVTYLQMVDHIMRTVSQGKDVCVAFYGHPGVLSFPSHEALQRARAEGYRAQMLPGISSEDCLIAELGYDPGSFGCQSFEASDFLINPRQYDDTSFLILWQIGVIGEAALPTKDCNREGLRILVERLCGHYSPSHKVIIYEAPTHMLAHAKVGTCQLNELSKAAVTATSTLCVPPNPARPPDEGLCHQLFGAHSGKRKRSPSAA